MYICLLELIQICYIKKLSIELVMYQLETINQIFIFLPKFKIGPL